MLAALDAEIGRLEAIRAQIQPAKTGKPRNLTPEGRRRIVEAQQRRWARAAASR